MAVAWAATPIPVGALLDAQRRAQRVTAYPAWGAHDRRHDRAGKMQAAKDGDRRDTVIPLSADRGRCFAR